MNCTVEVFIRNRNCLPLLVAPGFIPCFFYGVCIAHLSSFQCREFCFVIGSESCMPNVVDVSGLSTLVYSFGFL
jgi:hypothetical protein